MSLANFEVNTSQSKHEPPCITPGGGDLTSKQRNAELEVLRFKVPLAQPSPRSRARSQKVHAPGEGEVRRRAISLQERAQSPRVSRNRSQVTPRRRSMPPQGHLDAGRRVCQTLALNAWRAQRTAAARLRGDAKQLSAQLGGLQRQTTALRLLLDDEKLRVATAQRDAQRLTSLLAEGVEDRAQLEAQVARLNEQLEAAEQRLVRADETRKNFDNNLLTAKSTWTALDGMVARSEAQLARLRVAKVKLQEKIDVRSEEITAQQATLFGMQRRSKELQIELDQQLSAVLRQASEEVTSECRDEQETLRAQLLEEVAGMRAQRERFSALLNEQAQRIASRDEDIADLETELAEHVNTECDLRRSIAASIARLSVTWYDRLRGALRDTFWYWLRTSDRLH